MGPKWLEEIHIPFGFGESKWSHSVLRLIASFDIFMLKTIIVMKIKNGTTAG